MRTNFFLTLIIIALPLAVQATEPAAVVINELARLQNYFFRNNPEHFYKPLAVSFNPFHQ